MHANHRRHVIWFEMLEIFTKNIIVVLLLLLLILLGNQIICLSITTQSTDILIENFIAWRTDFCDWVLVRAIFCLKK